MPEEQHVHALAEALAGVRADHLHRQPRLVFEIGPVKARFHLPDEAIARLPRDDGEGRAGDRVLREKPPEAVWEVLLIQEIAVRQKEAAPPLFESLRVADFV